MRRTGTGAARRLAVLMGVASLALGLASGAAARPFLLGFSDGAYEGASSALWLSRSVAADAQIVRIDIGWDAPPGNQRPPGFDARNPADPHYNFTAADAAIRAATADGLRVLAQFSGAPGWAEGPGRPAGAAPGSWNPSPAALHDYGIALASRYSGHFPDPERPGQFLPRVAAFQVWNEPNLSLYLSPQYVGTRSVAPVHYRQMLNAFYSGVKSVDARALVVTAGTAPFGDPPGGERTSPVPFWQSLLCLGGKATLPRRSSCPDPAHFDVMAHHPYSVGPPTSSALQPGDVSIPDLAKLTRLLRAAERFATALPREHHPLWVTETSYNSSPPDPGGVPVHTQARWLEQTMAELWRGGASAVLWYGVGDQPPAPTLNDSSQSGVYYLDGRPKPALAAFRFPFVTWPGRGGGLELWGHSPVSARISVQRLTHGRWLTVRRIAGRRGQVFTGRVGLAAGTRMRAVGGGQISPTWPG